jgi:nitrogen fixation NifU-like protein
MSESSTLYDDVILDHIKNARNYRVIEAADRQAEGVNPLCGDTFTVYVNVDNGVIRDAAFQCSCCGISMASASVMTELVRGQTIERARALHEHFMAMLADTASPSAGDELAELAVLGVIRDFPSRRNCAALAWYTLAAALEGRSHTSIGA